MTDEFEQEQFEEKPFLEHLEDLRMTLLKIIVTTIAGALVCLAVSKQIFSVLKAPISRYAAIVSEQGATRASEEPSSAQEDSNDKRPKPSSELPQPGTRIIVTDPLTGFILLARDLFVYSKEAFTFLTGYNRSSGSAAQDKRGWPPSDKKRAIPPAPPADVSASDGTYTEEVRVKWNASSGATSYEVWRGSRKNPRSASRIGKVSRTSYSDASVAIGKAYYYWVKAKNAYGTSRLSSCDSGWRCPRVTIMETGPTKGFMVVIKTAFICGLGGTLPLNLFFLAQFVFPALTRKEKKYVTPSFFIGGVLFVIGLLFGYFLTLPLAIKVFVEINARYGIDNVWRMSEYLGTATKLLIANGVVFEMPLLLTILVRIGVLTVSTLRKKRRHAIIIILFVAAILTPADAITMFMLAGPMYVMYEACIWVSWALMRNKRKREEEEERRESYWEERRRIKHARKPDTEKEKKPDTPADQPPAQKDSGSPPEEYGEGHWHEDQSGREEPPEEGGQAKDDSGTDYSRPEDEEPKHPDDENPERRDD